MTHLRQATDMLIDDHILAIQRKFPNWSKEEQLKGLFHRVTGLNVNQFTVPNVLFGFAPDFCFVSAGGIASYNMGENNVISKNVDEYTTHQDYANDVVARAKWFIKNGYDD